MDVYGHEIVLLCSTCAITNFKNEVFIILLKNKVGVTIKNNIDGKID